MTTRQSMRWLEKVQKHISYPPDRKRVSNELYDHIMQRIALFSSEGYSDNEADRRTAEAMGDPDEVGKALSKECRPFWGWTLLTLRALVLILAILLAAFMWRSRVGFDDLFRQRKVVLSMLADDDTVPWVKQSAEAYCGEYHFRLLRAKQVTLEDGSNRLILELSARTWDPTLGSPTLHNYLTCSDSGGAILPAGHWFYRDIVCIGKLWVAVDGFDPAAEWAVLDFDNGDRGFSLPIRLEGGK